MILSTHKKLKSSNWNLQKPAKSKQISPPPNENIVAKIEIFPLYTGAIKYLTENSSETLKSKIEVEAEFYPKWNITSIIFFRQAANNIYSEVLKYILDTGA